MIASAFSNLGFQVHYLILAVKAIPRFWSHPTQWPVVLRQIWHHAPVATSLLVIIAAGLGFWSYKIARRAWHKVLLGASASRPPSIRADAITIGNKPVLRRITDSTTNTPHYVLEGAVQLSEQEENTHIKIIGTTGSGKTQIFYAILNALQERRKRHDTRAVVYDTKGDFMPYYWREGDLIFNPLDKRSVDWCPFAEIRPHKKLMQADISAITHAIVPEEHGGLNKFWTDSARDLLGETIECLFLAVKNPTNWHLKGVLSRFDRGEMLELLSIKPDSQMRAMFLNKGHQAGADKMMANVKGSLNPHLKLIKLLNDKADREAGFSFRKWTREGPAGQWLFLTRRPEDRALVNRIYGTMISAISTYQTSIDEEEKRRSIHYILDELPSAGAIDGLDDAMKLSRAYKGSVVIGLQSLADLDKLYGRETAEVILGNAQTSIVMKMGDENSAGRIANFLGKKRGVRRQMSGGKGQPKGYSEQHYEENIISATELINLPKLVAYVKKSEAKRKHERPKKVKIRYLKDRLEKRVNYYEIDETLAVKFDSGDVLEFDDNGSLKISSKEPEVTQNDELENENTIDELECI